MQNIDLMKYIRDLLIKIENAIMFIEQEPPKYILCYHKVLGICQKISECDSEINKEVKMFLPTAISINKYLLNGRYLNGYKRLCELREDIKSIYIRLEDCRESPFEKKGN